MWHEEQVYILSQEDTGGNDLTVTGFLQTPLCCCGNEPGCVKGGKGQQNEAAGIMQSVAEEGTRQAGNCDI